MNATETKAPAPLTADETLARIQSGLIDVAAALELIETQKGSPVSLAGLARSKIETLIAMIERKGGS